ncbi:MAG: NAD(P)-dependent glycerol-3-phosphate dehydrogenase [Candidatus Omnitrophota bacterium]|nr:MAG: NAD(P)-dependent glycerol-3-phosphate dehydrogenase [Candidatus Omnitrophota bacterium]
MAIKKGAKVAVIGDGGWGTTLAIMLHNKGYKVEVWGPFADYIRYLEKKRINSKFLPGIKIPKEISFSADIGLTIEEAALIVLAVPSHFLRGVLARIKEENASGAIILSAVKGIENDTLLRMSEVVEDVLGKRRIAVLSGPTISYEVARGIPATCVVSSEDIALAEEVQDVFMSERFRVYTTGDIIGVELGGASKNVIAIACGISDGLGFGANSKAAILTRGLVEIARLGQAQGARPETFSGLSGLGDLVTTCISSHGRNRWVGEQIGRGKKLKAILSKMEMVAEGVRTTQSVFALAKRHNVEMPITSEVYAVLYEDKDPKLAVEELMLREKKAE